MRDVLCLDPTDVLFGESKVLLSACYCDPTESLEEFRPDLDGMVIIYQNFAAINRNLPFGNLKGIVRSSHSILNKTQKRSTLPWSLALSQINKLGISLVCSDCHSLRQFRQTFEDILWGTTLPCLTKLHNKPCSGFVNVYANDAEWILSCLDKAVQVLHRRNPQVSTFSLFMQKK